MKLFKLKIVLTGYSEEVSRTILVPVDIDFEELHQNIQRAMGWETEHRYAGESIYTQINTLLRKGDTFEYLYDMGDDWKHEIEVVDTIEFTSKKPILLESIGECPKENSR